MDEKDLKQIRELFREEFKTGFQEGFGQIWEHNLEPALNQMNEDHSIMKTKLDKALYIETERITTLENWAKEAGNKIGVTINIK